MYKVSDKLLIKIKNILESYSNPASFVNVKNQGLGDFITKRKFKAKQIIKELEDEYYL